MKKEIILGIAVLGVVLAGYLYWQRSAETAAVNTSAQSAPVAQGNTATNTATPPASPPQNAPNATTQPEPPKQP